MTQQDQKKNTTSEDLNATYQRLLGKYDAQEINANITLLINCQKAFAFDPLAISGDEEAPSEEFESMIRQRIMDYYKSTQKVPSDIKEFFFALETYEEQAEAGRQDDLFDSNKNDFLLSIRRDIKNISVIRPKKYIMALDNISQHIQSLPDNEDVFVGRKGKAAVTTAVTIDCPEYMKIDGNIPLTSYDKSLINAVSSIIEAGNTSFSVPTLYHAMTGKENPTVEEGLAYEIETKLDKLRRLMITIDLTNEIKARFIDNAEFDETSVEKLEIEGYLLPLSKITAKIYGKQTQVYQILDMPPLYKYAKMKKQLATVPIELLKAPINNNSTTIPLKSYLLTRIEAMKNRNNNVHSTKILFDSIYAELNETNADKTKKKRIRDYTRVILDHFVSVRYIAGYTVTKKGRLMDGIELTL